MSHRSHWYDSELDSEHVWYRGFDVSVDEGGFRVDDPDVDALPELIVRAAWGHATRSTTRMAFPYDFAPSLFTGAQYCPKSTVRAPTAFLDAGLGTRGLSARGSWVAWGDGDPAFTDRLEVVFTEVSAEQMPARLAVTQVVFDADIVADVDVFVVAATRVLEPLIGDIRRAIAAVEDHRKGDLEALRTQIDHIDEALREGRVQPSSLRAVITGGLAALAAIILNIISTHLDLLIPWEVLWNGVRDAGTSLGL